MGFRKRRQKDRPGDVASQPASWLLLAQREIELRKEIYESKRDGDLYRELQMVARMRAEYPTAPPLLASQFQARLAAGEFSEEAWAEAVKWLEATSWFKRGS